MKKAAFVLLFALLASAVSLPAQVTNFSVKRGNESKHDVKWTVTSHPDGSYVLIIDCGSQWSEQHIDADFHTVYWHRRDPALKNDFVVTKTGDQYSVIGVISGKPVNVKHKSEGYPWCQSIAFSAGRLMPKDGTVFKYENVMPKTGKIYPMQVSVVSQTNVAGRDAYEVKCTVAGVFAGIWSCRYYIDKANSQFLMYRGVEGGPGTPETVWSIK